MDESLEEEVALFAPSTGTTVVEEETKLGGVVVPTVNDPKGRSARLFNRLETCMSAVWRTPESRNRATPPRTNWSTPASAVMRTVEAMRTSMSDAPR
jgi:hypothetical protein